jgi:hypothetical protein
MQQRPSREAHKPSSASQDIHRTLRNPEVHYRYQKIPIHILNETNPVHALP